MPAKLEDAIYSILAADSAVAALVGTRIYVNQAEPRPTQPYITFVRVASESEYSQTGSSGMLTADMQTDCWDDDYDVAKEVDEAVRLALENYAGTIAGITIYTVFVGSSLDNIGLSEPGSETGLNRITRTFEVSSAETVAS